LLPGNTRNEQRAFRHVASPYARSCNVTKSGRAFRHTASRYAFSCSVDRGTPAFIPYYYLHETQKDNLVRDCLSLVTWRYESRTRLSPHGNSLRTLLPCGSYFARGLRPKYPWPWNERRMSLSPHCVPQRILLQCGSLTSVFEIRKARNLPVDGFAEASRS
jgi:hypothetical protein